MVGRLREENRREAKNKKVFLSAGLSRQLSEEEPNEETDEEESNYKCKKYVWLIHNLVNSQSTGFSK